MRTWNLRHSHPLNLTLAADARLAELNYSNDQIWEMLMGKGEAAAITLQTTYGLRARSFRIFPQFTEAHQTVTAPKDFESSPAVLRFAPNYLKMALSPFIGIEVIMETWVPDGQTIAGRILVRNKSDLDRKLRLELCAVLAPNPDGKPMSPRKKEAATILQGETEDLAPVLFITGGASGENSPFPHLFHDLELAPDAFRRFTWVLASKQDDDESFRHARLTAAQNWDAGISRVQMLQAQDVQITTGDQDWDAALAFAQNTAHQLAFSPTAHLPHQSFVSSRLPDQGYSLQGSGAEYSHLWSGQTPLEAWYLSQMLLPGSPDVPMSALQNFLEIQTENGLIDNKAGLGGQRSTLSAAPFLVSLAWEIYQTTQDAAFLKRVFRPLLWYIQTWFWDDRDHDQDGVPEWNNLLQTYYDDNPAFSQWQPWARAIDIQLVEAPDLAAYLFREINLLIEIASLVGEPEPILSLQTLSSNLEAALQTSWNGRRASYQYVDRDNHRTPTGETLKERTGPGEMLLDLVFGRPTRLQLRLESGEPPNPKIEISVHASLAKGQHRVETITAEQLTWVQGISLYTFPHLYSEIEHLHIQGFSAEGKAALLIPDLSPEDHTQLTPIWAGAATGDQLEKIISRKLTKETSYGKPYGIPAIPKPKPKAAESSGMLIWLPWNAMVAEGLLRYGKTAEAADLYTRNMTAVIHNLKAEKSFRSHYQADQLTAAGQRNHLIGLPAPHLFLKILGVQLVSPGKIKVVHLNPFPWEVKLAYRGTSITCTAEEVRIDFHNRESISVKDQIPCVVQNNLENVEEGS